MNGKATLNSRAWTICAMLLICVPGLAQAQFDEIYFFGDSLSDPGNHYLLTGETSKAPYEPVPIASYAIGGHQFSNGKTWAQKFAQNLNANDSGRAALAGPGQNGNYAFGRARSRATDHAPSGSVQVGMFFGDHVSAPPGALYVLAFGGNDVRDALLDPANAGSIILTAVATEIGNIQALYGGGARNFLIVNVPNLGRTPAVVAAGPAAIAGAENLSQFYNDVLESGFAPIGLPGLSQLEVGLPDIRFYRLDLFDFINTVADNPGDFGLTDPFFPCLLFGVQSEAKCDNAEERLFWDATHPTTVAHGVLANVATDLVSDE